MYFPAILSVKKPTMVEPAGDFTSISDVAKYNSVTCLYQLIVVPFCILISKSAIWWIIKTIVTWTCYVQSTIHTVE